MKLVFRRAKWALLNACHIALLWQGLFHGLTGARYVGIFVCWIQFCMSLFLFNDQVRDEVRKGGAAVPYALNVWVDLIIVLMLAWCGYFVTATAWLLHIAFYRRAYEDAPKPADSVATPP